jgi:hypothetical protein
LARRGRRRHAPGSFRSKRDLDEHARTRFGLCSSPIVDRYLFRLQHPLHPSGRTPVAATLFIYETSAPYILHSKLLKRRSSLPLRCSTRLDFLNAHPLASNTLYRLLRLSQSYSSPSICCKRSPSRLDPSLLPFGHRQIEPIPSFREPCLPHRYSSPSTHTSSRPSLDLPYLDPLP